MVLLILLLLALALASYYTALFRRAQWSSTPLEDKVQLLVAPLPIVVGSIAALSGYSATERATIVAVQQAATAAANARRDSLIEVRRTLDNAASLYTNLIVSIDRSYVAAAVTRNATERAWLSPQNPPDAEGMQEARRVLIDRFTSTADALHEIAVDPFASRCYRQNWLMLDRRTALVERALEERYATTTVAAISGDPMHVTGMLHVGAVRLQTGLREQVFVVDLDAAKAAVRDLTDGPLFHAPFLDFAFLGNALEYRDNFFRGMAAIRDMLMAVPGDLEMRRCLESYYSGDQSLEEASRQVPVYFEPAAAAPLLFDLLMRMEAAGLDYVLDDVPKSAESYWRDFLSSPVNEKTWDLLRVQNGRLVEGESQRWLDDFEVESVGNYMAVGLCDESCVDLGVTIDANAESQEVIRANGDHRVIIVMHGVSRGALSANVDMRECEVSSCGFVVALLQEATFGVRPQE